jgi:hypothetical protein
MRIQRYFALGFAWLSLAPLALSQNVRSINKVPGGVESTAQRLTHALLQQGFDVSRGYFKLYQKDDCDYSYAIMGSCYGNNPAAPYILPVLPTWPDEYLDSRLNGLFGPTQDGYSTTFRLDPREAIVILGQLPPPAKYFGLQTNVFTRQGDFNTESDQYHDISKIYPNFLNMFFAYDPLDLCCTGTTRVQLLASLGNSINNVVIQNASSAAFNQQRYFITTPDQFMEQAVKRTLADLGIEGKEVFTEPISSLLSVGLEQAADDFYMLIRYAMPKDANERHPASQTWQQHLPFVVLRVRDPRTARQAVPYEPVKLDARLKTDPPETALANEFTTLVYAVCQRWGVVPCVLPTPPSVFGQNVWSMLNVQPPPVLMVGPDCIPIGMNCVADTQDTTYSYSPPLPFGGGRVYAAVGALSTQTGNATYVGLGITASKRKLGIDNVSDSDLLGSADDYWLAAPDHSKFFVYYFARDCTTLPTWASGHCRSIAQSDLPDYDPSDPNGLMLSLRDYIFPSSERAPDAASVLVPYVIAVKHP